MACDEEQLLISYMHLFVISCIFARIHSMMPTSNISTVEESRCDANSDVLDFIGDDG